jgi:hypothetical protein
MNAVHTGFAVSPWVRILAGLLSLLFAWVVASDAATFWADAPLASLFVPVLLAAFGFVAIAGREPPVLVCDPVSLVRWLAGRHPERATREQCAALRRLGQPAGIFTSAGDAQRRILLAEGRLPPTLAQQRDIARHRPTQPLMTRASAQRFLAERAADATELELEAWWIGWCDAGVEIALPHALTPAERAAFDAASAALFRAGVPYPLPERIDAGEVAAETARMQLGLELPRTLADIQREFLAHGLTRRPLTDEELRAALPVVVDAWRRDPDIDWSVSLHYAIARDRPAALTEPWTARAFVAEFEAYLRSGGGPDS